jgi:hypothetical protein
MKAASVVMILRCRSLRTNRPKPVFGEGPFRGMDAFLSRFTLIPRVYREIYHSSSAIANISPAGPHGAATGRSAKVYEVDSMVCPFDHRGITFVNEE